MGANNLHEISGAVTDSHKNFVVEELNDHCLRLAVMEQKTFPWHSHPDSDELFIVLEGKLVIEFEDGSSIALGPGDFHKVGAGRVHRTTALGRTVNLCLEATDAETIFLNMDQLIKT